MATSKTLELSIKIAGRMDKSLTAAINGTQSKIGSLTKSISNIGTVGLATMGAVATAAAVGIAGCTKEAQALESAMAPVVRYVDGLADASGAVSDAIADNGKTFKQNYGALKTYIQDLSTEIPRTTDQLTAMSAALGQSGIGVDQQLTTGYLRDTAVTATAMDLDDQTAGNYVAKWEASFNFDHKQVMTLLDQINYLGAHNATTAGEIAQSVNSAASMGQIAGVDPAATAAMATAMQATGVATDRVGTSISRIYTNLSKGSNATKAQKEMWEELGFTAEGIAKSMQTDGVGTLKEVFTALQDMPDERKVAALSTLFGQWAIEGGAKITNNLGAYEKALAMVSDPSLYTGSMEREFIIQASTSESIDTMVKNSVTALKQDIGTEFLPVKKTLSLAVIDLMNGVRKDMPQLQTLAGTLADLLSAGISKLGDALQAALPYVQKTLDYVANNGPQVAGILGGLAGTFAAMKFAPLAGNILEGAGSLLFGESGGLGAAAGGSKRSGGLLGAVSSLFTGGQKFAGAAPVIAAISGIIAVVSILGDHLEDIRGIVVNVFGETGGQVFDVFTGKLQGVADFVTGLFSEGGVAAALAPLQNTITNLFGENAGAAFGGVVTILQSIMGVVGQIVTFATGTVKPIIQDVFAFITGTVLPIILQTFTAAAPTIGGIITNLGSAVMSTIQGIFQGLITFITGVFSGSWSQAWEGIKQIFGSAFDGLVALCKAPLNAVIAIINKAISGINGLGLTIPKWVPILGGKSFSVNIPTLPMLARGGFTDGVSIAGEAGTEAVISFQRGVRSDNINTWTQAGRMLGVSGEQAAVAAGVPYADGGGAVELATLEATQGNNAVELQEIDTGKPQPEQDGGGTPDGGGQVVFAPQITVQGNADRAVLESVLDDAQQRFELWYEQMMRRKARTAY